VFFPCFAKGHGLSLIVYPFVGVKSVARDTLDKSKPSFEKTGFAAYRAVDVERIKADPELAWVVAETGS
jgi:hypothetical protein